MDYQMDPLWPTSFPATRSTRRKSKRSSASSPMSGISGNSNGFNASDFSFRPWKPTKKRRFRCWAVKFRAFTSGLQSLERLDFCFQDTEKDEKGWKRYMKLTPHASGCLKVSERLLTSFSQQLLQQTYCESSCYTTKNSIPSVFQGFANDCQVSPQVS